MRWTRNAPEVLKTSAFPSVLVNSTEYIFYCKRAILHVFLSSFLILTPHPPLRPASACVPPAFVAGGGGSIFWKTRDIGLPYYSKICTLWLTPSKISGRLCRKIQPLANKHGPGNDSDWWLIQRAYWVSLAFSLIGEGKTETLKCNFSTHKMNNAYFQTEDLRDLWQRAIKSGLLPIPLIQS